MSEEHFGTSRILTALSGHCNLDLSETPAAVVNLPSFLKTLRGSQVASHGWMSFALTFAKAFNSVSHKIFMAKLSATGVKNYLFN